MSLVTVISTLCHPLIMSYQWFLVGHLRLFEIEPITFKAYSQAPKVLSSRDVPSVWPDIPSPCEISGHILGL